MFLRSNAYIESYKTYRVFRLALLSNKMVISVASIRDFRKISSFIRKLFATISKFSTKYDDYLSMNIE